MNSSSKATATAVFVLVLLGLGVTDAVVNRASLPTVWTASNTANSASSRTGVVRSNGPDVFDVLNQQTVVTESTQETSLLRRVIPDSVAVESRVLLKGNDRIAFFSWVESPDVKEYFTALKEALHASFSKDVRDLIDETQEQEGKPIRNVLSFYDPAIHEDRLLFVRVRQRMYEFHVAADKEPQVQELMDALTD